jgi:hypothetical protein
LHKGQIITLDFIFALSIAVALVFVINSQWNILLNNMDNYENSVPLEMAAHQSSMYLLNGRGYPEDWNSSNVKLLGLIDDRLNVISQYKLDELLKIDNASLSQMLGIPEYNVFINITTVARETLVSTGLPPENFSTFAMIMNYAGYDNQVSKVYVVVWK